MEQTRNLRKVMIGTVTSNKMKQLIYIAIAFAFALAMMLPPFSCLNSSVSLITGIISERI